MLTNQQNGEFIAEHGLPDRFSDLITKHYAPLVVWVANQQSPGKTLLVGISGAQGTGKTTLADYLRLALEVGFDWQVAVLSIDDFYLTRKERTQLAQNTHPLLATRGVPGTHDLHMLATCIEQLKLLGAGVRLSLPRFDKAHDDRSDRAFWPAVTGPVDLIILEGWCVGSAPEPDDALLSPINVLERDKDHDGSWRHYVNDQLKGSYSRLFTQLDKLVFLQASNFESVYRWRQEQEEKLAVSNPEHSTSIMNTGQLAGFMQYFERLTRANLATLPVIADVVLELDEQHHCVRCKYAEGKYQASLGVTSASLHGQDRAGG